MTMMTFERVWNILSKNDLDIFRISVFFCKVYRIARDVGTT